MRLAPAPSLALLASLACLATLAIAQDPPVAADARVAKLEAACASFLKDERAVGLAAVVLEDGQVVLDARLGLADREASRPVDGDTLFRLGSVSKPVCATIAMQLVEQGELDLARRIGDDVEGLTGPLASARLEQLLSHTAGVRHYRGDRHDNGATRRTTREALDLFVKDDLVAPPGTRSSYSTHAFTLVVAAIERAAGASYVDLVRALRERAGAPGLDCELLDDDKPQRSALYGARAGRAAELQTPREDNSWKWGGGGLEATALDLARFGQAVLEDRLVSAESRRRMWTPVTLNDGKPAARYGLGWALTAHGAQHGGSQQGCSSVLILEPAAKRVVVVLVNTDGVDAGGLGEELRALSAR